MSSRVTGRASTLEIVTWASLWVAISPFSRNPECERPAELAPEPGPPDIAGPAALSNHLHSVSVQL